MWARALGTWSRLIGSNKHERLGPIAVCGPAGLSLAVGAALAVGVADALWLIKPLGL